MNQIECGVHPSERGRKRLRIEHVRFDQFGCFGDLGTKMFGAPSQATQMNSALLKQRQQPAADIAGCARQQDYGVAVCHVERMSSCAFNVSGS